MFCMPLLMKICSLLDSAELAFHVTDPYSRPALKLLLKILSWFLVVKNRVDQGHGSTAWFLLWVVSVHL